MNRQHDPFDTANSEILRHKNGAIDYGAYDARARCERSRAFVAGIGSLARLVRVILKEAGALAAKGRTAALQAVGQRSDLHIGENCVRPLGS